MKCPQCGRSGFNVYNTDSTPRPDGWIDVVQNRKCKHCGKTGKTSYEKWVCLDPKEKPALNMTPAFSGLMGE